MLAENMDAQQQQQQQQQKFRAKRDLDADEIRELFESSQNARRDDDYEPGCTSLAFTQINCLSTLWVKNKTPSSILSSVTLPNVIRF